MHECVLKKLSIAKNLLFILEIKHSFYHKVSTETEHNRAQGLVG